MHAESNKKPAFAGFLFGRLFFLLQVTLVPLDQWCRSFQLLAIDHRVGQHVLYVLARFVKRNGLDPDIIGQVLTVTQPLTYTAGTGVVCTRGQNTVPAELSHDLVKIGSTQLDIGVGVEDGLRRS